MFVFGDYVENHGIKKHILKWKIFSTIIALISDKRSGKKQEKLILRKDWRVYWNADRHDSWETNEDDT